MTCPIIPLSSFQRPLVAIYTRLQTKKQSCGFCSNLQQDRKHIKLHQSSLILINLYLSLSVCLSIAFRLGPPQSHWGARQKVWDTSGSYSSGSRQSRYHPLPQGNWASRHFDDCCLAAHCGREACRGLQRTCVRLCVRGVLINHYSTLIWRWIVVTTICSWRIIYFTVRYGWLSSSYFPATI